MKSCKAKIQSSKYLLSSKVSELDKYAMFASNYISCHYKLKRFLRNLFKTYDYQLFFMNYYFCKREIKRFKKIHLRIISKKKKKEKEGENYGKIKNLLLIKIKVSNHANSRNLNKNAICPT